MALKGFIQLTLIFCRYLPYKFFDLRGRLIGWAERSRAPWSAIRFPLCALHILRILRYFALDTQPLRRLVFTLLTLQPFDFLAAAIDLSLIPANLLLLLIIGVLLSLQLVANQSTGAEPKAAANRRTYARTTQ